MKDVRNTRRQVRQNRRQQRWASYLALSQPRYRPTADTLRLKARVLRRRTGRPYRQPLTLWLAGSGPAKRLAELRPVRPGSYEYVLPLADTLGLRPDTYAYVYLKDPRGDRLAEGQFRVEDYELNNARYTLRVAEKAPRHGQPQAVFVRGTDANELPLLDARVRLVVVPQPGEPGPLPGRQVFIADTLWTHTQALDPLGETRIDLPASGFPDVDFGYLVQATFLTADNERHVETASVAYHHDPGRLHLVLSHDSLRLSYDSLGRAQPHRATLRLDYGHQPGRAAAPPRAVQLPLRVPLDFLADYYQLTDAAGRTATLELAADSAGLSLRSDRTADSVVLAVDNPRRLPFWYFVYRGNALRYRGYGRDYQLRIQDKSLVDWHVSLHYAWGAAGRAAEYTVSAPQRQLVVATDQPAVAYPGQKIKLHFTVTDEGGRPVPDADLTAYAYTSKFDHAYLPALPDFRRPVVGRQARRRFKLKEGFGDRPFASERRLLPWHAWHTQLGLDSLLFYQFLYPESGEFREYRPAPGGLTQVAPFVVDSGRVRAPIAVYVDGQPAYIHEVNQQDPYAITADSGLHTLSLRLPDRLVTLRNVYLRPLHKLTLSLDINHPRPELTVEKRPALLTPAEQLALARSLVLVNPERQPSFSTLRQGTRLRVLPGRYGREWQAQGPFRPDSVLLRRADGLRAKFLFEPLFVYSLRPQQLKMVSVEPSRLRNLHSAGLPNLLPLADFALTEANIRSFLSPAFEPEALLDEPTQTPPGQGRLTLRLPPRPDTARAQYPLPTLRYVLLTRPDQPRYLRLSHRRWLPALAPGRYRVAVLLSDSTCLAPTGLAVVQPNGQTYLQLRWADRQPAGALSRRIGRLVRARYVPVTQTPPPPAPAARPAPPTQSGPPQPDWRTLRGQVLDYESEEGLPGVTVLVRGTTVGTSTTADGSFTLQVPPGSTALVASSVGYVAEELPIGYATDFAFKLRGDAKALSEVVVVGYGVQQRRDVTGAVATITGLTGRVSGLQVQSRAAGANPDIRVTLRGTASLSASEQPLLIVNGRLYTGQLTDFAPSDIAAVQVLKGVEATSLYGTRAANGVLIITTTGNPVPSRPPVVPGLAPTPPEVPIGDPRLSLRRRFRDYAWWQPTLITDAQGRAHAEVVLPDDVTSWDTFVIGSDGHRRLGAATGRLRAYKALLAELAGPRFLVAGDQTQVLGKVLNYRADTALVTTTFKVGAQVVHSQARRVSSSVIDTLTVAAPAAGADSVQVTFGLAQAGGYADGEQRSIAIMPAGTRERVGTFAVVTAADTTVQLPLDPKLGEVTVHLESDALPTLLAEIQHLQAYAYLCNEQLASKLLALLLEQRIRVAQGEVFKGQKAVNMLIRKLQQGRQSEGLWATWVGAAPSLWVTAHALEALLGAEKAGFKVDLDRPRLQAYLLRELDERLSAPPGPVVLAGGRRAPVSRPAFYNPDADEALRLLRLLHQLGTATDYRTYLDRLDQARRGRQPLDRYLAATELRQQLGLPYQLDTLRRYRLRTELGGAFYADTARAATYFRYLLPDRVGATLLAYRVLRAQGGHEAELVRIRTFLLGLRGGAFWGSTYQAAQILATIGPDLLAAGGTGAKAITQVQLRGAAAAEAAGPITKFPFDLKLAEASGSLLLRKTGALPVYATAYQTRWNPAPEAAAKPFAVTTTLAGQPGRRVRLRAGQPAELVVTVEVAAEARYVLLEVPIPAGCSYGPPPAPNRYEVHRENLRHQAGIFIDQLPIGKHTFRVALQPRFRGQYTLNPARAELLYFPTRFGRTGSKQVEIR